MSRVDSRVGERPRRDAVEAQARQPAPPVTQMRFLRPRENWLRDNPSAGMSRDPTGLETQSGVSSNADDYRVLRSR